MIGARYFSDYYYVNHSRKCITFHFESKKRVKTKVLNFLKIEHQESKINEFLKQYDLKLEVFGKSKRYLHYKIIDVEA